MVKQVWHADEDARLAELVAVHMMAMSGSTKSLTRMRSLRRRADSTRRTPSGRTRRPRSAAKIATTRASSSRRSQAPLRARRRRRARMSARRKTQALACPRRGRARTRRANGRITSTFSSSWESTCTAGSGLKLRSTSARAPQCRCARTLKSTSRSSPRASTLRRTSQSPQSLSERERTGSTRRQTACSRVRGSPREPRLNSNARQYAAAACARARSCYIPRFMRCVEP